MRALAYLLPFFVVACATANDGLDPDTAAQDDQAETGTAAAGKADASGSFFGLYTTHTHTHKAGDITSLLLQTGVTSPSYIRERCYHTSCALPIPETDRYDVYTSSSGKTYLRFWSFTVARDASGDLQSTPAIADVYEIKATSTGVKLRKSYTTRWFTLYRTTADAQCTATGGTPDAATGCTCAGDTPGYPPANIFVAGAGGCIATPGSSEDNCDGSTGLWTDDDGTPIGTYCECGLGRYDDASGTCATI